MTDEDVRSIQSHTGRLSAEAVEKVSMTTPGCTGSAAERAECSAARAENVADKLDAAAEKTEQAADRTEAIATKMAARSSHHHKN
jgi:hypothetical protein